MSGLGSNVVEIIPNKLSWAPGRFRDKDPSRVLSPLLMCGDRLASVYKVHHYHADQLGKAFGPLNLAQTLRFCITLWNALESGESPSRVVLGTPPDNKPAQANSVVLIGAYLIWIMGWTAAQVASSLGDDAANLTFPCSWMEEDVLSERVMKVFHCWGGFELALSYKWLPPECFRNPERNELLCKEWEYMLKTYDAAWLVPGTILLSADPTTTVVDPNPETFKRLTNCDENDLGISAQLSRIEARRAQASGVVDPKSPGPGPQCATLEQPIQADDDEEKMSCRSTHTNNKRYGGYALINDEGEEIAPFFDYLQALGVTKVVRANFDNEPGMTLPSYNETSLKAKLGIQHMNVRINDHDGGVPVREHIAKVLDFCDKVFDEGGAIAVHCKGGFGRSAILACAVVIDQLNVDGAALLGWLRVVRPGAITTHEQETFLCSLKGSKDLRGAKSGGGGHCCTIL